MMKPSEPRSNDHMYIYKVHFVAGWGNNEQGKEGNLLEMASVSIGAGMVRLDVHLINIH